MTPKLKQTLCALGTLLYFFSLSAQSNDPPSNFETLINNYIHEYELSPDILFRLAAYTEMKGEYSDQYRMLTLDFGSLGSLAIYERNCLLRTHANQVYHLDRHRTNEFQSRVMNENLSKLFDKIILLSNSGADPEVISFVDENLSKKNIEPFEKIFLRHILLRYGRFDHRNRHVEFHTDWLPDQTYGYRGPEDEEVVQKPVEPMKIKLDEKVIRGYYLWSGGTVYVEDVDRNVEYATGEEYAYNVAAFKLFAQKMFVQTTHFIVAREEERLETLSHEPVLAEVVRKRQPRPMIAAAETGMRTRGMAPQGQTRGSAPVREVSRGIAPSNALVSTPVKPLYTEFNWIPMMLGILRANGVNIGDEDMIKYFIDQPYFPRIYDQLTREERMKVDKYRQR